MNLLTLQNPFDFFQFFFSRFWKLKIFKSERNVTNFGYFDTIIAFIFFKDGTFINVKKIEKIHMDSEKSINSIEMEKRIWYLIIYRKILLSNQFVNNFSALLLCKINILDIFDMSDVLQIFVTSRHTEILIESNFWLGKYVL